MKETIMKLLEKVQFDLETVGFCITVAILTLSAYWFWLGKSHLRQRKNLESKLNQAQQAVRDLEEKLLSLEQNDIKSSGKEIRIWMDGAFDMMHYGHMNAFRQGKALGTYLIVGVNSDETITACKGKPVCAEKERIETVRGCKFVDEVVEGVPYVMSDEYLTYVIEKYKIDFVVHGDDPCIVDGKDVYESARKLGKYLTIPRTEGISTTDIVGRMLLMTKSHHAADDVTSSPDPKSDRIDGDGFVLASGRKSKKQSVSERCKSMFSGDEGRNLPFDRKSNFLTTSRTIRLFGAGVKVPKESDRVVYLAGAWDMFHAGHIETLQNARKLGDYVIVGVHNDNVVNQQRGSNLPIMNLHERVLSVLGCKFVDDVLIDAPYVITQEMLSSLRIHTVVKGSFDHYHSNVDCSDDGSSAGATSSTVTEEVKEEEKEEDKEEETEEEVDMYALPRKQRILKTVQSSTHFSVLDFVERIQDQRDKFSTKFASKMKAENEHYNKKHNL